MLRIGACQYRIDWKMYFVGSLTLNHSEDVRSLAVAVEDDWLVPPVLAMVTESLLVVVVVVVVVAMAAMMSTDPYHPPLFPS